MAKNWLKMVKKWSKNDWKKRREDGNGRKTRRFGGLGVSKSGREWDFGLEKVEKRYKNGQKWVENG
jgi:hypothetical protein